MNTSRELALVQLWETFATLAKAAFFFLATPVLLARLGQEGYGLLAMSFAVMACVLGLDFGLRPYLRVALSALPAEDDREWPRVLAETVGAFLCIQIPGVFVAIAGARAGLWSRWLGLGAEGDLVLVAALLGSLAYTLSLLLIEPLAARRRLSLVKAASFLGYALAVPVVIALAHSGASALGCALGYIATLTAPNLALAALALPRSLAALLRAPAHLHPRQVFSIVREGRWFAVFTALWLARSYLLTFLVSAMFGPALAGVFFILLKLSELVSVFGANTSETAIAELAATHAPLDERRARFLASYRATLAASIAAFAGIASLTPVVIERWFHLPSLGPAIGVLVAGFGLAGGFTRVVASACMGLGLTRSVALWGFAETGIVLGGIALLRPGIPGTFAVGIAAGIALVSPARAIARALDRSGAQLWIKPALAFLAALALASVCALAANSLAGWPRWAGIAAACACGAAAGAHIIRQLHAAR